MINFSGLLVADAEQFIEKILASLKLENIQLRFEVDKSEQDCLKRLELQSVDILIIYHHPPTIDALRLVRSAASRRLSGEILVIAPAGYEKVLNQSILDGAFAYCIDVGDCYKVMPRLINRMIDSLTMNRARERALPGGVQMAEEISSAKGLPLAYEEKLKILDHLISFVAHEMKNPFTTINNALYFLQRKIPDRADPIFKKYIGIIEDELTSSNRFLSTLHSITRKTTLNPSFSQVNEVLKETVQQIPMSKKIKVIFQLDSLIPSSLIDLVQIQTAFSQVIRNAIQAMPKGGELRVQTVYIEQEKMIEVDITDQGVGIEPDHLSHICEAFFTTKGRNIGLGLTIAQRIIEAHKGRILFDSAPGQGTKCTILLPQS